MLKTNDEGSALFSVYHNTSGAKPASAHQQVMSGVDEYLHVFINNQLHWGVIMRWDVAQSKAEVARWT